MLVLIQAHCPNAALKAIAAANEPVIAVKIHREITLYHLHQIGYILGPRDK
jgi:ribosomal protein S5